jgi:hypothetical protein
MSRFLKSQRQLTASCILGSLTLAFAEGGGTFAAAEERWLGATLVAGRIEFEAPESVDWEKFAPRGLVGFELSETEPALISALDRMRNMFDDAELNFDAPLPESLQKRFFYFVSRDGIQELRAERLRGIVRFGLGEDGTPLSRLLFGYVIATAADRKGLAPAGFVLGLDRPATFEVRAATQDVRKLVPQAVRDNWESLSEAERQFWTVEKQYTFRLQGEDRYFTFVQWLPDKQCHEACCEFRYSVLVGLEASSVIAMHYARCDI